MRPASRRTIAFESLERRDLLSGDDMVEYRLALTDTSDQPLPTDVNGNPQVAVGQTFRLYGYSRDVRLEATPPSNAKGVFAAYMDVFYTNADLLTIRYGETQRLQFFPQVDSPAITGTFKLTFDGQETPDITYDGGVDYLAEKVQLALEALPNIGPGNVRVTVEPPNPKEPVNADTIRVQFLKALGERDLPEMTINPAGLTNYADVVVTQLYPGDDPTNPGTFRTAFTTVKVEEDNKIINSFMNGLRAVDKTELEPGQDSGGRSFGGVGSFLEGFTSTALTKEMPFFSVDLKAVSPGVVEFSGNPSNSDVAPYEETDTLVFPSASTDTKLVVEPQYQAFVQDIDSPLVLTVLPRNVLTVDSTADTPDANPGDGLCAAATGACTLRAAIQEANALANLADGPDLIAFTIPGPGPYTIQPASALPTITDSVVIDATTQAGYAGTPIVELRGDLAGAGVSGLRLETGGNTLKGLAINRFAANGIFVLTGGGNTIQGNFLGTNLAGTAAAPNARNGIDVRTAGNTIGGAGLGEGNLISGNTECGILTLGGGSSNVILGNRIGTNQAGTAAVANGQFGIYLTTPNNQVGGTASGAGNLISGNRSGVAITESTATGNALQGNRIGTSADGSSAVSNVRFGVTVANNTGNTVGGTEPGSGNVVSGNGLYGVLIVGPTTKNNKIQGNLAGLNAAGTTAVPNGQIGVAIFSPDTLVGGPGGGNVISGNLSGVWVGTAAGTGAIIQGNLIGTDVSGTLAVPNQHYGVYVSSPNNLVGGVNVGEGNVISGSRAIRATG
jgi:CSLREA domain-containing protein